LIASRATARFPRSRRLLSRADFQRILSQPGRSADGYFAVAARRLTAADIGADDIGQMESRLGLAISRKALPRAVDRNRIKRIVREAFRQTPWPCPADVVVIARVGLRHGANAQVRRSVEAHFETIRRRLCGTRPPR
jgi:ribonuclease P protein component